MTSNDCRHVAELLLEFADGELSAADNARVAQHLDQCEGCRGKVDRLQRSLSAAQKIWREAAAEAPQSAMNIDHRPLDRRESLARRAWLQPLAIAVSLTLAAGACWLLLERFDGDQFTVEYQPVHSNNLVDDSPPADVENSASDVEQLIQQHAQSARLAVSLQILADAPGVEPYRKQAERYLARAYGEADDFVESSNKEFNQ